MKPISKKTERGTLTLKQLKKLYRKATVATSGDIPEGQIWIVDEKNFKFRRPRHYPKYVFRIFGRIIRIYIEKP